ncbi:MAG: MarR family winged helix-turn-helix transcriptional regulator [Oscillospiraceae bacterium]|nr:MarR family winged helix-turn-helix transcriptional regulator [Oscillospiraceae bacterium]
MLDDALNKVYTKFKLQFYRTIFSRFQSREASLTTVETFCMEIIMSLGKPTVNEFSRYVGISAPNAAYKINNLVQKGYVVKEQSADDKREYFLVPTQKFYDYYNISYRYVVTVTQRIREHFPSEDVAQLERMLNIISSELMPEIEQPTIS